MNSGFQAKAASALRANNIRQIGDHPQANMLKDDLARLRRVFVSGRARAYVFLLPLKTLKSHAPIEGDCPTTVIRISKVIAAIGLPCFNLK